MQRNEELRRRLLALAEPEYRNFSAGLLPNVGEERMLGVRLPALRALAKELARGDWQDYLRTASDASFEEVMLQGMTIGNVRAEPSEILPYVAAFVPKIDNWSVCDSFCTSLTLARRYPETVWDFLQPYLSDTMEYSARFGVVMLLHHYVTDAYFSRVLVALDRVPCGGRYYVQMAVAWAVSVCFVHDPGRTMAYLQEETSLDDFTYNKALQKMIESFRVDGETKRVLRGMKRKGKENRNGVV